MRAHACTRALISRKICSFNAFAGREEDTDEDDYDAGADVEGVSLFVENSFINHCCAYNAKWVCV